MEETGGKKNMKKRQIKLVATTSLPAVDRPNVDHWNTTGSCQLKGSSDLYTKICKFRPVPKITDKESFANVYFVYKSEEKNSPTEDLNISLLKSCIANKQKTTQFILRSVQLF